MTKMISHRVWHKRFDDHPAVKELNKATGLSVLDHENAFLDIECDAQFIIPQSLEKHPVIDALIAHGFDPQDEHNLVYLPINPCQAFLLGKSHYTNEPIESYVEMISKFIAPISDTQTFDKCKQGDKEAYKLILGSIRKVQEHVKGGLEAGQCHAAYPYTDEDYKRDLAMWGNLTKQ